MKRVLILLMLSGALLGAADQQLKLPKWNEVFPSATLWSQTQLEGIETYAYATDTSFEQLKAQLQKHLADGWRETPVPAKLAKRLEKDHLGIATFTNPAFPGVTIGLVQNAKDILGKKTMVVVSVIGPK